VPISFLLQTFLLSVPRLEDAIIGTLSTRYAEAVQQCITQPSTSLDTCPYHVDTAAKQTLLFSALAALSTHLQSEEVLAPSQLLPQVSRVLLTTQEPHADKFLEAVAASLAGQMHAGWLSCMPRRAASERTHYPGERACLSWRQGRCQHIAASTWFRAITLTVRCLIASPLQAC
jgi:hypothetical protein